MNRGWASFILCNKICKIKMFTWLKWQSVILHKRMGNMMDRPILKPAPLSPNFKLLNSVLKEKCMNLSSKLWLQADSLTREKLVTVGPVPLSSLLLDALQTELSDVSNQTGLTCDQCVFNKHFSYHIQYSKGFICVQVHIP